MHARPASPQHGASSILTRRPAFTLVELLAVIGIASLLLGILAPAVVASREAARVIQCASNERQICQALFVYAAMHRGLLPMNIKQPKQMNWYDYDRLGKMLTPSQPGVLNGVGACPADAGALRSYSMNVWAGCAVDSTLTSKILTGIEGGYGSVWRLSVPKAERMILVGEMWSAAGSAAGWVTSGPLATTNSTPGRRFGGGVGVPPFSTGRFGQANSELPFLRHRPRGSAAKGTQPIGRVNLGYADGHVALKANTDLVDPITGLSTLDSWWSPKDTFLNY